MALTNKEICAGIAALLTSQRKALRGARFADLAALGADADRLAASLPTAFRPGSDDDLRRLAVLAERTLRDIACALQGVRAAAARVAEIKRATTSLDTYDRLGRSRSLVAANADLDRRY